MLASGADPVPLLRALFPTQAGEPAALAALAERLQSAVTWRCLRLLFPLHDDSAGASVSDAGIAVGWPETCSRALPQMVVASQDGRHLLLRNTGPGRQVQLQWLTAGPCRPVTHHPRSVETPPTQGGTASIHAVLARLTGGLLWLACEVVKNGEPTSRVLFMSHFRPGRAVWIHTEGVCPHAPVAGAAHAPCSSGDGLGTVYLLSGAGILHALDLEEGRSFRDRGAPRGSWRCNLPVGWPDTGGLLQPVGLRLCKQQLLAMCLAWPEGPCTPQLQVWATPCPVPEAGATWQLLPEACADLPSFDRPPDVRVCPLQDSSWLALVQPHEQRHDSSGSSKDASETAGAAGQPGGLPDGTASEGQLFMLEFDLVNSCWRAAPAVCPAGGLQTQLMTAQLGEDARNGGWQPPLELRYFQQLAVDLLMESNRVAAGAAEEAAEAVGCERPSRAAQRLERLMDGSDHRRFALFVVGSDSLIAVWQEWGAPLPPVRLGEIAAPSGLPYSLRLAQQARAVAAAAAADADANADGRLIGRCMDSKGSALTGGSVLLRLAADPSLPPIACPLSAVHQSRQLACLLELRQEDGVDVATDAAVAAKEAEQASDSGGAGTPAGRQPQVVLVGVRPEEHAALRQLARCLAGETHAGLLEAACLLDVVRLADLLDAPALMAECVAVLECIAPGPELFAPLLALAEGRQYHARLQRLQLVYRHALTIDMLQGGEPLLRWAQHGLQARVDAILEVCTEVAATWLPLQPGFWLASPQGDLAALASPDWQASLQEQPGLVRPLLLAALEAGQKRLGEVEGSGSGGGSGGARNGQPKRGHVAAPAGPFQSAAVRPPPDRDAQRRLPAPQLAKALERVLRQLARALPKQQAQERERRTARVFAEAEALARRQALRGL